jgi:hypothetical protein
LAGTAYAAIRIAEAFNRCGAAVERARQRSQAAVFCVIAGSVITGMIVAMLPAVSRGLQAIIALSGRWRPMPRLGGAVGKK